jgi:hypothetical protein
MAEKESRKAGAALQKNHWKWKTLKAEERAENRHVFTTLI